MKTNIYEKLEQNLKTWDINQHPWNDPSSTFMRSQTEQNECFKKVFLPRKTTMKLQRFKHRVASDLRSCKALNFSTLLSFIRARPSKKFHRNFGIYRQFQIAAAFLLPITGTIQKYTVYHYLASKMARKWQTKTARINSLVPRPKRT